MKTLEPRETLAFDFFDEPQEEVIPENLPLPILIPGLEFREEFITLREEIAIVRTLDAAEWSCELSRRVQHYGFKYDYKSRRIDESMHIGSLPEWLNVLAVRLHAEGYFDEIPDQVIVNEYLPGQGISAHIDCQPCFGDTLVSLSLCSTCVMDFTNAKTGELQPLFLPRRSIAVLKGDSRYCWKHGIAKRRQDVHEGQIYPRKRRISLTFRKVKWS